MMTAPKPDPALALEASRVRIRAHLYATAAHSAASEKASAQGSASIWMQVLAEVVTMTQKGAMVQSLGAWWTRITQQHPVRLVVCVAAAGAAIVWMRPWRWLTAAAITSSLAVAVDLLTRTQTKDNAWSAFMDSVLQRKGPPQP